MRTPKIFSVLLIVALLLVMFAFPVFAQSGDQVNQETLPVPFELSDTVNGVLLSGVVFGLVAWLKKAGVQGTWLLVCSLFLGLALGIGYQNFMAPLVDFADWFSASIYGLALGLTASGVYEGIRSATAIPKG